MFAKIRRVWILFRSAVQQGPRRRKNVTVLETLAIVGVVLLLDVAILLGWTLADPLQWERHVIRQDVFGYTLESQGQCTSDSWMIFGSILATLHIGLIAIACYMCYAARDIPTEFSEGKYLAVAMVSNLQIYIVGIPVLILVAADPDTSFFVRSAIIWMNDFVVLVLIFGNLIKSVHLNSSLEKYSESSLTKDRVSMAVQKYSTSVAERRRSTTDMTPNRTKSDLEILFEDSSEEESSSGDGGSNEHMGSPKGVTNDKSLPKNNAPQSSEAEPEAAPLPRRRSDKDARQSLSKKMEELSLEFQAKDEAAMACARYRQERMAHALGKGNRQTLQQQQQQKEKSRRSIAADSWAEMDHSIVSP